MINPRPDFVYYTHFDLVEDWEKRSEDGHATVAMKFDIEDGLLYWSVAWCAPSDKFDKRYGKVLAAERLEDYRTYSRINNFNPRCHTSYYSVARALLEVEKLRSGCPSWVKNRQVF